MACADSVPGSHFISISPPESLNLGIGITSVPGNFLIANGGNISKAGFTGVLYTSSSTETSYSNKSTFLHPLPLHP